MKPAQLLFEAPEAAADPEHFFGLESMEVSEHDILRGAALEAVHRRPPGDLRGPSA